MIEYDYSQHIPKKIIKVKLDGCIVGKIKVVQGGYRYFPKGQKTGGDIFTKLSDCQRSLESE